MIKHPTTNNYHQLPTTNYQPPTTNPSFLSPVACASVTRTQRPFTTNYQLPTFHSFAST
ncbi:MAG: hypothetical protein ACHBN1_17925 [Heteroscytonema crispum UTEX LB 1556]